MPTTWNRSPEEFHKIYVANTEAFYKVGGRAYAKDLDAFMTQCALSLWSKAGNISQHHVDMANEIYSKGQKKPTWMLWSLMSSICENGVMSNAVRKTPDHSSGSSPTCCFTVRRWMMM